MENILVLCTANSCRSQMAEAYLRFFTGKKITINSAGLESGTLDTQAVKAMQEDNIDISDAITKEVSFFSNQHFDYVLWVCTTEESTALSTHSITADTQCYFDIPDPTEMLRDKPELDTAITFSDTRELVKKEMLRFIGKYLALPVDSNS